MCMYNGYKMAVAQRFFVISCSNILIEFDVKEREKSLMFNPIQQNIILVEIYDKKQYNCGYILSKICVYHVPVSILA